MPTAMLVTTACGRLSGSERRTGVVLAELGAASAALTAEGWHVDLASPTGGEVPIDAGSLDEDWVDYCSLAAATTPLADLQSDDADAWYVLGGHGVLFDLVHDEHLRGLLSDALLAGRAVGAVDHGSAVLAGLRARDQRPLVTGRRLTGRSDVEEQRVGHHLVLPRSTERTLRDAGAVFTAAAPWRPHVVQDGPLVTGQNPASAGPTARVLARTPAALLPAA